MDFANQSEISKYSMFPMDAQCQMETIRIPLKNNRIRFEFDYKINLIEMN